MLIDKLVLSSPPITSGEDGSLVYNEDCLLMARVGFRSRFAWCRPGDTAWTSLKDSGGRYHGDDFTYFSHNQLFYSLTPFGNLESWDIRKNLRSLVYNSMPPKLQPTMDEHQVQLRVGYTRAHYHLVDSCSELLVVVRYCPLSYDSDGKYVKVGSTGAFDVYKFDFERENWVYVPNLGNDRVLFLDKLNSFSLSLSDGSLISGNSIYFSFGKEDSGVCNLDDGSITTFLPQCSSIEKNQFSSSPSLWIYPRL